MENKSTVIREVPYAGAGTTLLAALKGNVLAITGGGTWCALGEGYYYCVTYHAGPVSIAVTFHDNDPENDVGIYEARRIV